MKQQQLNAPHGAALDARRPSRRPLPPNPAFSTEHAQLMFVEPKLTRLVNTKIIVPRGPALDARSVERERLVDALLRAKGSAAVTRAADALFAAGHEPPEAQEPHLQLLEHADESRVRAAAQALERLLDTEPPKHRPVLEQRLRRIEDTAEELATRDAAKSLRRRIR